MGRKILLAVIVLLVAIQFIRPSRNLSADHTAAINASYNVPDSVMHILKRSCFDCHSNHTNYLWYFNVQPLGWWLQHHVNEGKEHLNFSEFTTYPLKDQIHALKETAEQVEDGEMPLSSYTNVHKEAKLSEADKALLIRWASTLSEEIANQNPGQSSQHDHDHKHDHGDDH
jgi:hypothetical protein